MAKKTLTFSPDAARRKARDRKQYRRLVGRSDFSGTCHGVGPDAAARESTAGGGGPDTMAALAKTRRERAEKFNGSAAYLRSPAKGLRVSPDGRAEQDEFAMVEVVTATSTEAGGALTRQC